MIPSKKSREKHPQVDESSDEHKSSKNTSENGRKRKMLRAKDLAMNRFTISGYTPLTRITNLGWKKAQTMSHTHLSPSLPKSNPK
jgi:hypothetical protein